MDRIRFSFSCSGKLKYISHLDMMRLFVRALRRTGLPVAYSQGYNPHPRFNLALPLPTGAAAEEDYGEVYFDGIVKPQQFIDYLKHQLPNDIKIKSAFSVDPVSPALPAEVSGAVYKALLLTGGDEYIETKIMQTALDMLMAKEEILVDYTGKKKKATKRDIRSYIYEAEIHDGEKNLLELILVLQAGSEGGVSPVQFLELIRKELDTGWTANFRWELTRKRIIFKN
ncbi:MAG: TIGR03936 family radical SAM-associated protein [Bacillota bacterium]|nr:TIGR03936 family radical SAM-associated protein [Bacillota bacterium]